VVTKASSEPDERILGMLQSAEPAALLVVVTIAVLILGAWFIPNLEALAPMGWSNMVATTAGTLLLASVGLALSAERRTPLQIYLSQAAGLARTSHTTQ
jgi:hypothetical protein